MRLYASLPCNAGPPMACCGESNGGGGAPSPCRCSMSPMAPSPAVVDGASPDIGLGDAPASSLVGTDPVSLAPLAAPEPIARAAPLFVLFVAFLN
jgi:hypothetical protein